MVARHRSDGRGEVLAELAAERQRLQAEACPPGGGLLAARERALTVDHALLGLLSHHDWIGKPNGRGWALAAVGGYGRCELSPHSDVDLLILTRRRDPAGEQVAKSLLYALWDAGLEVAPAVRSVAEALSLAARDVSAQTACLQARFLAGDQTIFDEFQRRALADARREGGRPFLRELLADLRRRHERFADAAYGLEPDLKEGRGGLRDVHSLLWAGLVTVGATSLADLARAGYLEADEVAAIESAVDLMLRVRHHLHRLTDRKTDRLYYAYQQDVATSLGYAAANGHSPIETFMRDLNARAAAVSWASEGFWELVEDRLAVGGRGRPARRPSRIEVPAGEVPGDPDGALRLFAEAARRGIVVGHGVARKLKATLSQAAPVDRWSAAARESFLEVLRAGDVVDPLLEAMDGCGLLSIYLPEWEAIRYLTHHDVYHRNTVDRHSALTVHQLGLLTSGRGAEGSLGEAIAADLSDGDPLLLAGLLHDVGKGLPGDHAETGAGLVRAIAGRMGLDAPTTDALACLVRDHLLLARTATRRDLDDESVVRRLADRVGDPDRLRMLYLLTVADSVATGPSAWTEWKAALVRDLFFRTLRLLQGDAPEDAAPEAVLSARRAGLRAALVDAAPPALVDEFLAAVPPAYVLSQSPDAAREHLALLSRPAEGPARVAVRHSPGGAHDEVTLIAADQSGLLWRVCGVFALHGTHVLEARAYTGATGQVLDVFRLVDAFEPAISEEKRAAIVRDLGLALKGRLSISYRLGRKLRHYRPQRAEPLVQTRVTIDNAASAEYTVVEVHARDRLGLLYAIARALSELHLDIHLAKVATRGPEAIDVFYVHDRRGQKVTDAEYLSEVERSILFELEEFGLEAKG